MTPRSHLSLHIALVGLSGTACTTESLRDGLAELSSAQTDVSALKPLPAVDPVRAEDEGPGADAGALDAATTAPNGPTGGQDRLDAGDVPGADADAQTVDGGPTDRDAGAEMGDAAPSGSAPAPLVAAYRAEAPVIDGVLTDWPQVNWTDLGKEALVEVQSPLPVGGDADFSARFALAWHDNTLFVAVRVKDDIQSNEHAARYLWHGDSVQLALWDGVSADTAVEVGWALMGAGLQTFTWQPESPASFDAAVARTRTTTIYEVALDMAALDTAALDTAALDTAALDTAALDTAWLGTAWRDRRWHVALVINENDDAADPEMAERSAALTTPGVLLDAAGGIGMAPGAPWLELVLGE